jgi:hypothetical protein
MARGIISIFADAATEAECDEIQGWAGLTEHFFKELKPAPFRTSKPTRHQSAFSFPVPYSLPFCHT